jgi:hypothetical protein
MDTSSYVGYLLVENPGESPPIAGSGVHAEQTLSPGKVELFKTDVRLVKRCYSVRPKGKVSWIGMKMPAGRAICGH